MAFLDMEKKWTLRMTDRTGKTFDKLDRQIQIRITKYFETKILPHANPKILGKALVGVHAGKWSYRIGDYRVLAYFQDDVMVILAIDIGHRRDIYETVH
jgi:mRNA interferase RelE/StbE